MHIQRDLSEHLKQWADSPLRKPLIIRGARQVGKSALVQQFANASMYDLIEINFELEPSYKTCFKNFDPTDICQSISTLKKQAFHQGKTLLFLDEIQDCPEAIQALRYFKEKMPELHVIAAGSLLELTLREADFSMPVGRVSFLYLYPLSFREFLRAINPEALQQLESATLNKPLPQAIHEYLLKQLKIYFWLGGLPESVAHYINTQDLSQSEPTQANILEAYDKDLSHFAPYADVAILRKCFHRVPMQLGQQIKYNKLEPDYRSRELKKALDVLEAVNLITRVQASTAQGLPLDATVNEKKFKLNFLDVGLVKRINQLDTTLALSDDLMLLNDGALAEQFTGQELLAYSKPYEKTKLYFWARDANAKAEVDYVSTIGQHIIPIEVKSGKTGRLRSLYQYLKEHTAPFGVRISQQALSFENNVLSIPLYMISELERIVNALA